MFMPIKNKKCKVCGKEFKPMNSMQKVCCPKCALEHARDTSKQAKEKAEKKALRERKAKLKTRSDWLREAQAVFNKYIRLRDKGLPCISCGRYHQGQWHAGHYRSVGACPELRFCEDNTHLQCSVCNNHKSGNLVEYRMNLIFKIGVEKVEWLERKDHPPKKYSIEDCKEIIRTYRAKIKELEKDD